jgi:Cof subfamily protein (haloacid dehalogenase superfamily)
LNIRLLALDIDGTLLDSHGRVPDANARAILEAVEAGVTVALATGRRYDFARPVVSQIAAPLTLILSNGAVTKTSGGDTLARHLLPRDVARDVIRQVPQHRDSAAVIFDRPREGQVVYEVIDWEHPHHQRFFASNRPFLSEVAPLEDCLTEDPIQVMFTGTCGAMRQVFADLRHGVPGEGIVREVPYEVALTEYVHRDFSLVDVIRAGCSKGSALRELASHLGVPAASVMAVGDNLNDLPMLEFAGWPVLMGNAIPDLRARGWTMTATNDEAGVAMAIEEHILARRG